MPETDLRDLLISTESAAAAKHYRSGSERMLMSAPGVAEALDQCLSEDPTFALGFAARARQHVFDGERQAAKEKMRMASELVENSRLPREQSHVQILSLSLAGKSKDALHLAKQHVMDWPRDILIGSLLLSPFGLFGFSGMRDHNQAKADICEKIASAFDDDDWWFLNYYGWSLSENGDISRGRPIVERGFELRRENANCVHALSHVMFDSGHMDEADQLLTNWLPTYDRSGLLHGHISWHAALSALEIGDEARVLDIYREHIQPQVSLGMAINIVSDAASLLWRMNLLGHAVPKELWIEAAYFGAKSFPKVGHRFIDTHLSLLDAGTGNVSSLRKRIDALDALNDEDSGPEGRVVQMIASALISYTEGRFLDCANTLEAISDDVARIGGSNAQRRVVEDTRVLALIKSGDAETARTILKERLATRPSPLDSQLINLIH